MQGIPYEKAIISWNNYVCYAPQELFALEDH